MVRAAATMAVKLAVYFERANFDTLGDGRGLDCVVEEGVFKECSDTAKIPCGVNGSKKVVGLAIF